MGYWQDKLDAYRNEPDFGAYDKGSILDYEYRALQEKARQEEREEWEKYHNKR